MNEGFLEGTLLRKQKKDKTYFWSVFYINKKGKEIDSVLPSKYDLPDSSLDGKACKVTLNQSGQLDSIYFDDIELKQKSINTVNISSKNDDSNSSKRNIEIFEPGYRLPQDTFKNLNSFGMKNIDNFNLKLNKTPALEQDKKFILQKKDKKGNIIYELKPNFQKVNFVKINKRHFDSIKNLGLEIKSFEGKTKSRMLIGLGLQSVYETSMNLHHIYGIPYIPSSSLKGSIRSFALKEVFKMEELVAMQDPIFIDIFGNNSNSGNIIFFDVFPTQEPKVNIDIMNPHHQEYYSDKKSPSGYSNPIPINFLALEKTNFRFIIGCKKNKIYTNTNNTLFDNKSTLEITIQILQDCITLQGLGAKTSTGYGYININ